MEKSKNIKEFIIRYFTALSAAPAKTRELIEKYVEDEALIEHILFFDSVFPGYEVFAEEMVAEGNKAFIRGRLKGTHKGNFNNIPPTFKVVEFPFAIGYEVENDKIVHHWLIADQAVLMEQLGLTEEVPA
jgi:predicted ester cyclase